MKAKKKQTKKSTVKSAPKDVSLKFKKKVIKELGQAVTAWALKTMDEGHIAPSPTLQLRQALLDLEFMFECDHDHD